MPELIYLRMEAFSFTYGWTPDQIRAMNAEDLAAYGAIINGKAARNKAGGSGLPQQSIPVVNRKMRRMM